MIIIENTTEFDIDGKCAVAIGKFDGIHLGHQKLLNRIICQKKNGLLATVFTFDLSAAAFFGGDDKELSTKKEKRVLFEKLGIDVLIEFPLNQETAAIEPEAFVSRYLVSQMHSAYIAAGQDLSFGKKGSGNYELLARLRPVYGYQVEIIDKVKYNGCDVSSTLVREAIRQGKMETAAGMLGYPYRVAGEVVHGKKLGRTIGMPTANIVPESTKLLPPFGVYYSRTYLDGRVYRSITNIGCKPTVSDTAKVGVETYLYDMKEDIYGRQMDVEFLSYKRPEMQFANLEQLKEQMHQDLEAGRVYQP